MWSILNLKYPLPLQKNGLHVSESMRNGQGLPDLRVSHQMKMKLCFCWFMHCTFGCLSPGKNINGQWHSISLREGPAHSSYLDLALTHSCRVFTMTVLWRERGTWNRLISYDAGLYFSAIRTGHGEPNSDMDSVPLVKGLGAASLVPKGCVSQ